MAWSLNMLQHKARRSGLNKQWGGADGERQINVHVYSNDFVMAFSFLFTSFDVFKVGKVHQRPLWRGA